MAQKEYYLPFDFFIFRSPLFPYLAKENMAQYLNNNIFNEALFLASPEFVELKENGREADNKMAQSLYKYFSRSFSRCTPFGLFAGCSIGRIGDTLNIRLKPMEEYTRVTRLDMNYICALIQHLEQQPEIQCQLKFYPNDSIYECGGGLRYVEYFYKKAIRIHHINSVARTDYLLKILKVSEHGATIKELADSITEEDITYEEAEEFILEVISSQILKSELDAQTTGDDPLVRLITQLKTFKDVVCLPNLIAIKDLLDEIDKKALGLSYELYDKIIEQVKTIGVSYELKYLFQADMYKPVVTATLPENFVKDINGLFGFLNRITAKYSESNLARFKDSFYDRYEEREIPLCQVLDKELGLGYPVESDSSGDLSQIIDDIVMPSQNNKPPYISFNGVDAVLLEKYVEAIQFGKSSIILEDKDFAIDELKWDDIPDTLSVMCNIVQDKKSEENLIIVKSIGGSGAGNLLGRFCHIDKQIYDLVKTITDKEQYLSDNYILAEIAHLPESRVGNILFRPRLRDYEIHYLANSGIELENQISISDIMISVKQNRIVLRSKKHNKEIIPRLTTAHNFSSRSMPVYNFLCDMQVQGQRAGLYLKWREIFDRLAYLPRIQYKNYILSLQQWNIKSSELKDWDRFNDEKLTESIRSFREKHHIQQEVTFSEGDNELYVDLENILSVRTMLSRIKNRDILSFNEFILGEFKSPVTGPEGMFNNEFIIPFYKNTNK